MSETTTDKISSDTLIIRKHFSKDPPKFDFSSLSPDSINRVKPVPDDKVKIETNFFDSMVPSKEKIGQFLEKESAGIDEVIKHIAVQADILSKRPDGNEDVKKSFENLVDVAISKGITSRDEINNLTVEMEERQNQRFVVESEEIIKDLNKYIEEVSEILTSEISQDEVVNFDLIYLYETRKRLITLSAQIKDAQTVKRIEESINGIQGVINKVISVLQSKVEQSMQKSEDKETFTLEPGKYEAYLELPISKNKGYFTLEVVTLDGDDPLIKSGELAMVSRKPFKIGETVARVTVVNQETKITHTYKLPEIASLNEGVESASFRKLPSK